MIASINICANQTLQALREISGTNILANYDDTVLLGAALLNERAALMNLKSPSQVSANGSCYLLQTKDLSWIALNLSRESDWECLPALFKQDASITSIDEVTALVHRVHSAELLDQGRLLGLPIALAKTPTEKMDTWFDVVVKGKHRIHGKSSPQKSPLVLDLSSLWAGPLCSRLLQLTGARVVKVESTQRPDGARLNTQQGSQAFYDLLNNNKEVISLDFKNKKDMDRLKQLIQQADIVIEGSRPRALQQLGIDAEAIVKNKAGLIWISITGYGRQEPQCNWVAFGDDAAISAGLFQVVDNKPVFIGDAIADPLTGLHAALAALTYWNKGEGALLDINLHTVARHCAEIRAS